MPPPLPNDMPREDESEPSEQGGDEPHLRRDSVDSQRTPRPRQAPRPRREARNVLDSRDLTKKLNASRRRWASCLPQRSAFPASSGSVPWRTSEIDCAIAMVSATQIFAVAMSPATSAAAFAASGVPSSAESQPSAQRCHRSSLYTSLAARMALPCEPPE